MDPVFALNDCRGCPKAIKKQSLQKKVILESRKNAPLPRQTRDDDTIYLNKKVNFVIYSLILHISQEKLRFSFLQCSAEACRLIICGPWGKYFLHLYICLAKTISSSTKNTAKKTLLKILIKGTYTRKQGKTGVEIQRESENPFSQRFS